MRVFFRKLRNLSFFIQYYCLVSETPCAKLCATLKLFNVKFSHQSYSQVTKCLAKAVCRRSEQLQFAKKSSLFWQAFVRFGLHWCHPIPSFYQNLAIHGKTFLWFGKNCAPSIMLHHPTKTFTRIYSWHFVPVLIQLVCAWLKILRTTFQHSEI